MSKVWKVTGKWTVHDNVITASGDGSAFLAEINLLKDRIYPIELEVAGAYEPNAVLSIKLGNKILATSGTGPKTYYVESDGIRKLTVANSRGKFEGTISGTIRIARSMTKQQFASKRRKV